MRAAIVGAGSLGTIIDAMMVAAGRPVDLIDTNRIHVEALNRDGALQASGVTILDGESTCHFVIGVIALCLVALCSIVLR